MSADASVDIVTFGCRLNLYESEIMRARAAEAGLTDAVIINTCAVTAEAERQARQAIRKARRERPGSTLIVTGCAAQIDPARYAAMPEVDRVLGNQAKLEAASYGSAAGALVVDDIMALKETAGHLVGGFGGRARAFLEVQQGCDHRCTFCIIPYGRGNSRSVPIGAIVEAARRRVEGGAAEIVLTGVDLTAYGADLPGRPSLGQMVRRLLALVPELKRLRLSSLDPVEIDPDLFRLIETEERLMPHLHLSLQAGDDLILKRMKRRHSRGDALAVAERLRALRPGIALGADLIAGFPTETEAMFARTEALIEECGLAFVHVFPYSPREGTPAARMPQVPPRLRKARAARLREAGHRARTRFLDGLVGSSASILVEENGRGHSAHFAPAELDGTFCAAMPGAIVAGRVTGIAGDRLIVGPSPS
jgi:threonylcarbamoyladenosine tRNA methylthiotransferase MtaB